MSTLCVCEKNGTGEPVEYFGICHTTILYRITEISMSMLNRDFLWDFSHPIYADLQIQIEMEYYTYIYLMV